MAVTVQVAGLCTVNVSTGLGGTQSFLGYTQNGSTVTTEGHAGNVPGDENGGDDGPPVEIQYYGETARVRLELSKWDKDVADQCNARLAGASAGTPAPAGTLVFANNYFFRLVLNTPNDPRNFPVATLVRTPIEVNKGTKWSRLLMEFECYKLPTGVSGNGATAGQLWNRTVA